MARVDTQSVYRSLTASVLSTGRQSAATEQVSASAQESSAGTAEVVNASEELRVMAAELRELVGAFSI